MLKWDHRFELGNEKIDAEHRIFLGLIIEFQNAGQQGAPKGKLLRNFQEICKYAEFHFLSEENTMIDHGYPDTEQHAKLHRQLLSEAGNKLNQLHTDTASVEDTFQFLFQWFALHTSIEDKKLVAYLDHGS